MSKRKEEALRELERILDAGDGKATEFGFQGDETYVAACAGKEGRTRLGMFKEGVLLLGITISTKEDELFSAERDVSEGSGTLWEAAREGLGSEEATRKRAWDLWQALFEGMRPKGEIVREANLEAKKSPKI